MTTYTPPPTDRMAVLRNLIGLILLVLAVAMAVTAAWLTHPLVGLAVTSVPVGATGWWLATSEA